MGSHQSSLPMNSILHIPSAVHVVPNVPVAGQKPVPNQYSLEVSYKPNMPAQRMHGIHASPLVAGALQSPSLKSFHLVTLKIGSPEQTALPDRPSQVLLGVQLKTGETVTDVPSEWMRLRRHGLWLGCALALGSIGVIVCNLGVFANLVATCAFSMGALKIVRARSIHIKPFFVNEGWGRFDEV